MLHAVKYKKSHLPEYRYGYAQGTHERRITREDEITSIVFGPFDFMEDIAVDKLVHLIFGAIEGKTNTAEIQLWPKLKDQEDRTVEPDVLITRDTDIGVFRYIIEVKWNAPVPEDQVDRQLQALHCRYRDGRVVHALISKYAGYKIQGTVHKTWMDISEAIGAVTGCDVFSKWCSHTKSFLEASGIQVFHGFCHLESPDNLSYGLPIFFPEE